jgi:hypothetical protein
MNERSKCAGVGGGTPHGGSSHCGLPHTLSLANGLAVWVLIGVLMDFSTRHNEVFVGHPGKYALAALTIAATLVIEFNLEQIKNYAAEVPALYRLAIYHLSRQADADEKARVERAREQGERAKQEHEIEAQRVKQEQEVDQPRSRHDEERKARIEQRRAVTAAWQEFLATNRGMFKQIETVKDSRSGDYNCLRLRNMLWDFVAPYKRSTELARQKVEASTYQARDSIADDFVRWLNSHSLFDRADWAYDDLQNMETIFSVACSELASEIWTGG